MQQTRSPLIKDISWGKVEVDGYSAPFRDVKLFPGGAREWDWRETGTRHRPGIQTADVMELMERGAEVVVLSTGFYGRLGVCPETLQLLEESNVTTHVAKSDEAVQLYNRLTERQAVAALIHSTC
jgi:hypothetical protein